MLTQTSPTAFLDQTLAWTGREKHNLIGEAWRSTAGGTLFATPNPATGLDLAHVPDSGAADVDAAVAAARTAFDGFWAKLDPYERERHLLRIADILEDNLDELATIQSLDMGSLLMNSRLMVGAAVSAFRYYAGWPTKIAGLTMPMRGEQITYTRREALGVVGAIIPWNGPALATAWKIAPAIACGNTVIFKPAPEAPLTSARMIELMLEAGLPAGVVNLVHGGRDVGSALVAHPGVAKVTFTGSTVTGQTILRSSADTMKKVTLELGGKSPTIIMPDADLDRAVPAALMGFTLAAGQLCVAGTRLLVHKSIADDVAKALADGVKAMKVGSAFEEDSEVPPIVSRAQLDKVNSYLASGVEEGAEAHAAPLERTDGFFVAPTLFTGARPGMRIVDEEIFGPVGVMMTFREEDEAVAEANRLSYGLAASVWSRDASTAHRLADRVQSGTVWVNTIFELDNMAPFGGYKMSGLGRELGAESIDAFTQSKTVVLRY